MPVHEICISAQIPRRAFYNWWNQYRLDGPKGLNPRPRTPPYSPQNPTRNRREDPHVEASERLVPHTHRRTPTQGRHRRRTHNHPPPTQAGWNEQPTPETPTAKMLQALAASAFEQPLAMRPQTRRRKMAHHNPRRPLQIRNGIPDLQGTQHGERDLAARPGNPRIREAKRDTHRSWIAILERPQRRVKLRRLLPTPADQAHSRRHRQAHNARKDRTMVPNLRPRTRQVPAALEIHPIL